MFFRLLAILIVVLIGAYLAGYSKSEAIDTTVEIDAPPEAVWPVLTDLKRYSDWNPFITYAAGDVRAGQKLEIALAPVGDEGTMRFSPWVQEAVKNERFSWLGRVGIPGIFDGHHQFVLEKTEAGTRLTHREDFGGLLLYFIDVHQYEPSFAAMNQALKARVEAALVEKEMPAPPMLPPAPAVGQPMAGDAMAPTGSTMPAEPAAPEPMQPAQ